MSKARELRERRFPKPSERERSWWDRHGGEVIVGVVGALMAVGFIATVALADREVDPIKVANYRCEKRGGVANVATNRRGDVEAVTCKDGTAHSTYMRTKDGEL